MAAPTERVAGVRTCVGCRTRAHRSDLVRLVLDPGSATPVVVVDPRAVAPGRGVWLHLQTDCLDRAVSRRAIGRGLRIPQLPDVTPVTDWFDRNAPTSSSSSTKRAGSQPMGTR
jgi:uncharacterized protein